MQKKRTREVLEKILGIDAPYSWLYHNVEAEICLNSIFADIKDEMGERYEYFLNFSPVTALISESILWGWNTSLMFGDKEKRDEYKDLRKNDIDFLLDFMADEIPEEDSPIEDIEDFKLDCYNFLIDIEEFVENIKKTVYPDKDFIILNFIPISDDEIYVATAPAKEYNDLVYDE